MPIVNNDEIPEIPWRNNYRKWNIVSDGDGTTSTSLSLSKVGTGAGAPLHKHADDEIIVILEGQLEVKIGNETTLVDANHTLVVPPNIPHAFRNLGPGEAKLLTFFPVRNPFDNTLFLEGLPPSSIT